ncbi:hypothetical protein Tcan_14164 [Toxocara canis]|uniref:Uncharacterized protein n=1 Tax=Toxocara canis TaxID=6265 RepID=A0A0B2UZC3_TOXCA|nr:hypothetical protein Tcan_14164 [Toxocara canis]
MGQWDIYLDVIVRGFVFEFLFGLVLNICGCALGIWRAEMDHGAIQAEVDQRLLNHGLISATKNRNGTKVEPEQPSSILMTLGTMIGRMFNVVGTVKMYKSVAKFVARKRREQLRQTAERLGGAEADADWSEALIECCQLFV